MKRVSERESERGRRMNGKREERHCKYMREGDVSVKSVLDRSIKITRKGMGGGGRGWEL